MASNDVLTAHDLTWGDVVSALSLMRFGGTVQVNIVKDGHALSYQLSPAEADEIGDRLHDLAGLARNT